MATSEKKLTPEQLPASLRNSALLNRADLELLCGIPEIPAIDPSFQDHELTTIIQYFAVSPEEMELELHRLAQQYLRAGKIAQAWQILLAANY